MESSYDSLRKTLIETIADTCKDSLVPHSENSLLNRKGGLNAILDIVKNTDWEFLYVFKDDKWFYSYILSDSTWSDFDILALAIFLTCKVIYNIAY